MSNNSNSNCADNSPMDEVVVARQAIYNAQLETIGYELLFRNSGSHSAEIDDGIAATQTLINTSFLELGIEQIVGSSLAFINLPHNFKELVQHLPTSLEQAVLEYPLTPTPTQDLIDGLLALIASGHNIALDQFTYTPEILPLLKRAKYIKVDIQSTNRDDLKKLLELAHKAETAAIAFKIENYDEFEHCKKLGFDAFQGFFFNRPNLVKKEVTRSNAAVLLKLIERINEPKSTIDDIEQLIAQDVSLSYKLLRYINCATFALRREITSIRDAITYIGLLQIRQWSTLLVISNAAEGKPRELLVIAMIRAHMCQKLASQTSTITPDEAFTVGLFSVLDVVMDIPMEDLLDHLPFTAAIKLALIERSGELGNLLKDVIHYEKGEWDKLDELQILIDNYTKRYLEAIFFSEQQLANL